MARAVRRRRGVLLGIFLGLVAGGLDYRAAAVMVLLLAGRVLER
jgi:hypothetical protein